MPFKYDDINSNTVLSKFKAESVLNQSFREFTIHKPSVGHNTCKGCRANFSIRFDHSISTNHWLSGCRLINHFVKQASTPWHWVGSELPIICILSSYRYEIDNVVDAFWNGLIVSNIKNLPKQHHCLFVCKCLVEFFETHSCTP